MTFDFAIRAFQAPQQASRIASYVSQTQLLRALPRRYSQMFSAGFSSGAEGGSGRSTMFSGTTTCGELCQPAASRISDGARADASADFSQVFVHGLDADCRHDQRGTGAARRADGAEEVGPGEPPVALDPRARAAPGPDAGQRALMADAGFILKPDFNRPAGKLRRDRGARQLGDVFLKASCASRSVCGCIGRTEMLLKSSFFRSLPTALMQMNIEFGGDAGTQVGTAPAYHAVGLGIRAVFHPLRHLAQLGFGQTRLTPRPGPVREPRQAVGVVAMNPVAQRLAIHSPGLRGSPPRVITR